MPETILINGLTLCHKNSDGWVRSTLPDVCLTPSPPVPVPYTNTAFARDLADGTTTVFSHGGAMNGIKGSRFAKSIGDEPGSAGGVASGVNLHQATWLSWSPNVFMEGKPVTRLTDMMLMNKGNTISAGGYYTGTPKNDKNKELLDKICEFACQCKAEGNFRESCIAEKMDKWAQETGHKVVPEAAYKNIDGTWRLRVREDGTIMRGGGRRPDFTDLDNKSIAEMKLPGDRYRGKQDQIYDEINEDTGSTREDINFKKHCKCPNDEDGSAPEPVAQPQEDQTEARERQQRVLIGVGVALAIVGVVAIVATGGAAAPLIAAAAL